MDEREYVHRYMDLYARGNALFLKYNPCEPHPDGSCIRTRIDVHYANPPSLRCCGGCQHHDEKSGCKAICLTCKLWTCAYINGKAYARDGKDELINPELYAFHKELQALQGEAHKLRPMSGCREDIQDTLKALQEMEKCQPSDKTQTLSKEKGSATSMTQQQAG
jgi:hypothetical protein